jgi:hypothetical protein
MQLARWVSLYINQLHRQLSIRPTSFALITMKDSIGLVLATLTSASVKVNPLPAPRNVTWGTSGPIPVKQLQLQTKSPRAHILDTAFKRAWNSITKLKWVPQAIEAPILITHPSRLA